MPTAIIATTTEPSSWASQTGSERALTRATRSDLRLPVFGERFTLIGELFGANLFCPEYPVGVRTVVVPDRLLVNPNRGGHPASGVRGGGWSFGIAWTPPAFF